VRALHKKDLIWCLVALVAVRIAIGAAQPISSVRPEIQRAAAFLRRSHDGNLRTVFFGSSRFQTAIRTDVWARRQEVPREAVVNLAVSDGRLWDALYMLRQGTGLPDSVDLVVIELSPWEFNRHVRNPVGHPTLVPDELRYWGGLGDRLAVDDPLLRMRLLGDYLWPLSKRRPLEQWDAPTSLAIAAPPPPPIHHTDPATAAYLAKQEAFQPEHIAANHFFDPEVSAFTARNLSLLLAAVTTKPEREIVLLQLPARRGYFDTVEKSPQGRAFYDEVQRIADSQSGNHVHVIAWHTADECGLQEDIFVDYGHLSLSGAAAMTNRVYDEMERRGWLPAILTLG